MGWEPSSGGMSEAEFEDMITYVFMWGRARRGRGGVRVRSC
jgi:hypothetical protein